ncbi:hypothetical protein [Burkholderia gladioli]|uniref:hypothetical protein n=1 Tax=Burkholderia gladioli TaxID=28095 RepID=UPI00163DFFA5|nr:hypothetical protein [Burkholderia gladioli]
MNTVGTNPLEMLEIRIASNLLALEERVKAMLQKQDVRDTLHAITGVLIMCTRSINDVSQSVGGGVAW